MFPWLTKLVGVGQFDLPPAVVGQESSLIEYAGERKFCQRYPLLPRMVMPEPKVTTPACR